jgi:hypothetical protein
MGDTQQARGLFVATALGMATALHCQVGKAADWSDAGGWRTSLADEPAAPAAIPEPEAENTSGKLQITAREWLSGVSKVDTYNHTVSTSAMSLQGGSIAYGWDSGLAVVLSGYYGLGPGNFFDTFSQGRNKLERLDVDAVVKFPIGTIPLYGAVGIRYIDFKRSDTAHEFNFEQTRSVDYKHYLGEFGLGSVISLDEGGKHRTFGGVMIAAGFSHTTQNYSVLGIGGSIFIDPYSPPSGMQPVIGMDTHFGYAYSPWPSVTISARYRAFVMADVANYSLGLSKTTGIGFGFQYFSYSLVHGAEINIAYQF